MWCHPWSGWNYCKCRWILLLCAAGCSEENSARRCQARCNPQQDLRWEQQQAAEQLIHQDGNGLVIGNKCMERVVSCLAVPRIRFSCPRVWLQRSGYMTAVSDYLSSSFRQKWWSGWLACLLTLFMLWSILVCTMKWDHTVYIRLGTFSFEQFSQPPNLVQ